MRSGERQMTYNEAAMLQRFEQIRNVFTPELLREKRGLGEPTTVPVFIVGMPTVWHNAYRTDPCQPS